MTINEKNDDQIFLCAPLTFNFEHKTLDELKSMREGFNLKQVRPEHHGEAYLLRMIDILLEKVERLENDNQ